jgi:steroid 5-alpha reductase family enzyme
MQLLLFVASHALLFSAILLFIDMSWVFLVALYLKSNGIVDVAYGLAYILVAATTLFNFGMHPLGAIATLLISIWGLRLAIRIHERTRGKPEDFRYAAWRQTWQWFKTRSYFQIYLLQGFIIFLVSIPVVIAASHPASFIAPISVIGIIVWIVGFLFEAIGDYQLDIFAHDPAHKGMLIQNGLWSITRHPNYFGEAVMWWGIWLVTLPAIIPFGVLAVIGTLLASPVLITFMLLKVSGVPMLEASLCKRDGWDAYASRVSVFVPWFPKQG